MDSQIVKKIVGRRARKTGDDTGGQGPVSQIDTPAKTG